MINFVAENLVNRLINNQIITNEDRDVYKYGLEVFISLVTKIVLLTIIAYTFNVMAEMAIFASAFFILRINAGGYHARTFLGCFIATVIFTFFTIGILNMISIPFYFTLILLAIANTLIFLYAPVDTPNKRLTQKEYLIYRRKSLMFATLLTLGIIIIYLIDASQLYYCNIGVSAFLIESITLTPLVNKKNKKQRKGDVTMKKGNVLLSLLALVAVSSASLGAGINCLGFLYQPKCPNRLRKN